MDAPKTAWLLDCLQRYWPKNTEPVAALPVALHKEQPTESLELCAVALPEWAAHLGVDIDGLALPGLLVPVHSLPGVSKGAKPDWENVDWWEAAFWYLSGHGEWTHEQENGPIHSYAFRLKSFDSRVWDRAWVNRIGLFLRCWAARIAERDEEELFGPLPDPEIVLSHDVDAVSKTLPVRVKQSAFHGFNAVRALLRFDPGQAMAKIAKGLSFLLGPGDYLHIARVQQLEEMHGLSSVFHFYGGPGGYGRPPHTVLLDPMYRVDKRPVLAALQELHARGWTVGLHPAYASWADPDSLRQEKERLESALEAPVTHCRQHWLRFSWQHTWQAQIQAGLSHDSTLGFNDRPGFRTGAALAFSPWDHEQGKPLALIATPLVAMDSHFFDYGQYVDDQARLAALLHWVDEIETVCGVGSVCWHQRVWSRDYGWGRVYEELLQHLAPIGA
ncbi:MAG: hypothetical protein D6E12_03180 [Desulfovibrio sp.]|nr:MAG: hypothetical protein D6E12_03180 [Desulfovibrio sp.]